MGAFQSLKVLDKTFGANNPAISSRASPANSRCLFRRLCRDKLEANISLKNKVLSRMKISLRFTPVATPGAVVSAGHHEMSWWVFAIALACGIWYFFILVVQVIGFIKLYVNITAWKLGMLTVLQISMLLHEAKASCVSNIKS